MKSGDDMKINRVFMFFMTAAVAFAPLSVFAESDPKGYSSQNVISEDELPPDQEGVMIFYERGSGELPATLVIPSELDGKPVYGIAEEGFSSCYSLVEVTVPGSVVLIGKKAFSFCKNLKEIVLSDGLIGIDEEAFDNCEALPSVVLPDTVTNVGSYAFSFCPALKSVKLSDNLSVLGRSVFYECTALTEITIPASVQKIGEQTFRNCKLLKTATVSGHVCGEMMFADCPSLESVTFLDRECVIPHYANTVCNQTGEGTKGTYSGTIRGYVGSTAEEYANVNHYRFEPLDPENVVTTPPVDYSGMPDVFDENHTYTSGGIRYEYMGDFVQVCGYVNADLPAEFKIPRNVAGIPVQAIGEKAFAGMKNVQSVTIPLSVRELGSDAFCGCPDLKKVTVLNPDIKSAGGANLFSNDDAGNYSGVICSYVPSEMKGYTAFLERKFVQLQEVRGDTTLDGIVSIDDAQTALKAYTERIAGNPDGLISLQKTTGDVNGDKVVSVEDAQLILKYYTENTVAGRTVTWEQLLK